MSTSSGAGFAAHDYQARVLAAADVHALCVRSLGLDEEIVDLESPEALAALVRRAASFASPCSPRALRRGVLRALDGLTTSSADGREDLRASIDETIEALTCYGDLLELPLEDPNDTEAGRTLYLAPPTYVLVADTIFLLGGAFDGGEAIPHDLRTAVEYRSHARCLPVGDVPDVAKRLRAIGWVELRGDLWLPAPIFDTPGQLVDRANAVLSTRPTSGDVAGLSLLDTESSTTYYRGRWREPTRKSGRFVARREQRYGADLWSYVEVANGAVTHLVDLPFDSRADVRPCDAAWHLQMALDARVGRPQLYRRRPSPPAGSVVVDFFSPVPLWARRKWDVLGEEITRSRSLFAYRFPAEVFADVDRTLRAALWLTELTSP